MMVVGVDPHKQTRWTARRLPVQPWVAAISACRAGALVMPSFCRWLIQGLNGSSLLSRLVALASSGAASGWRANRLMVSGSRPRMRAASRWECPACSSSCTAAWRSRVRATRARSRPHTSSSPSGPGGSAAGLASCGACCPGGASPASPSGAPAAAAARQPRCATTALSTYSPRLCHRCQRSATCTAAGAPAAAPSNGTVRYQNCPNACCRHARIGRSGRVMRRLGQAASCSQVLRCQGCSGVEKAILATTTP